MKLQRPLSFSQTLRLATRKGVRAIESLGGKINGVECHPQHCHATCRPTRQPKKIRFNPRPKVPDGNDSAEGVHQISPPQAYHNAGRKKEKRHRNFILLTQIRGRIQRPPPIRPFFLLPVLAHILTHTPLLRWPLLQLHFRFVDVFYCCDTAAVVSFHPFNAAPFTFFFLSSLFV